MKKPAGFTIFMLLKATRHWLALAPDRRFAFVDATLRPLLAQHPGISLRFFDAEAFSAAISDLIMWRTADMESWARIVEALRETPFWDHYFTVEAILPAIENGFSTHYGVAPLALAD